MHHRDGGWPVRCRAGPIMLPHWSPLPARGPRVCKRTGRGAHVGGACMRCRRRSACRRRRPSGSSQRRAGSAGALSVVRSSRPRHPRPARPPQSSRARVRSPSPRPDAAERPPLQPGSMGKRSPSRSASPSPKRQRDEEGRCVRRPVPAPGGRPSAPHSVAELRRRLIACIQPPGRPMANAGPDAASSLSPCLLRSDGAPQEARGRSKSRSPSGSRGRSSSRSRCGR